MTDDKVAGNHANAMNRYLTTEAEALRAVLGAPNRLTTGESRLREAHTTNKLKRVAAQCLHGSRGVWYSVFASSNVRANLETTA